MQGTLFRYGPGPAQIAFRSTNTSSTRTAPPASPPAGEPGASAAAAARPEPTRCLVLVAGLTEGLLALPYAGALAAAAAERGYSLVQAQLSSSYSGWGVGSLDADADDLLALSRCLRADHGCQGLVLMGHSTGAQDAVRFALRHGGGGGGASDGNAAAAAAAAGDAAPLEGVVLQAPVSDREWLEACHPAVIARLPDAEALVAEGRGGDVVMRAPDDLGGAPVSASRLVALAKRLGDDDMWSSDLTDAELSSLLRHMAPWPVLLLQSGADECAPDAASIPALGERLMRAMSGGGGGGGNGGRETRPRALRRHVVLYGAPHNAAGHEAALAAHVADFLAALQEQRG